MIGKKNYILNLSIKLIEETITRRKKRYFIDLFDKEDSLYVFRNELDSVEYQVVFNFLNESDPLYQNNVLNMFSLLDCSKSIIYSCFLSENENNEIDVRFMIGVNRSILAVNYDLVTGLGLAHISGCPLCITKSLFNEKKIKTK